MNAPEKLFLPDVQGSPDNRRQPIQRVGVKGLRYPVTWRQADGILQHSVAQCALDVALPAEVKGTHMSRFVALLESWQEPLDAAGLRRLLAAMLARLEASAGRIVLAFPYFLRKTAPVSGVESLLDVDAQWQVGKLPGGEVQVQLKVVVPVTSLCPCSKEISDYGAHNQRSHITLEVQLREGNGHAVDVESLVCLAEQEASCEIFGLLKRPDEKWVTERAYDNPKFVEDLVRDIALRLAQQPGIARWSVQSENFESIHNHSAYARIDGDNGPARPVHQSA